MSNQLRKIPTEWLDKQDAKGNDEDMNNRLTVKRHTSTNLSCNWETIMGCLSRETSRDESIPVHDIFNCSRTKSTNSRTSEDTDVAEGCCTCGVPCLPTLTHEHIGTARFIGARGLLFLRILTMSVLGILAGMALSMRKLVPFQNFLLELSVWLHVSFLLSYPFLVLGSLMTMRYADDFSSERDRHLHWTVLASSFHILKTFALREFFRLFVINAIPSLQPYYGNEGTEILFALRSIFAIQKYALAIASMTEILCSETPQHFIHIAIVVFLSAIWESFLVAFWKPVKPSGELVAIVFGSVALAAATSAAIVVIQGCFSRSNSKLSERDIERGASSIDPV